MKTIAQSAFAKFGRLFSKEVLEANDGKSFNVYVDAGNGQEIDNATYASREAALAAYDALNMDALHKWSTNPGSDAWGSVLPIQPV